MSFLLRSQPHVLSYSILDNKHMVLFCCLKNMKICAVMTNICVPWSKPSEGSQTLLDMLRHQRELIMLKQKKRKWWSHLKSRRQIPQVYGAHVQEKYQRLSVAVSLALMVSVVGIKSISEGSAVCVVGLGAPSLLTPCILWCPPPGDWQALPGHSVLPYCPQVNKELSPSYHR